MPAFFGRLLARLAVLGIFGALARRATRRYRTAGQPTGPVGRTPRAVWPRRLRTTLEGARLAGRAAALVAFAGFASVLVAAGTTLTALGPRWLGIALLVVAGLFVAAAAVELRVVLRLRTLWRRRRYEEHLRRQG